MSAEHHEAREAAGLTPCDSVTCVAKLDPRTLDEALAAVEHWRHHHYLYGCSHGR